MILTQAGVLGAVLLIVMRLLRLVCLRPSLPNKSFPAVVKLIKRLTSGKVAAIGVYLL